MTNTSKRSYKINIKNPVYCVVTADTSEGTTYGDVKSLGEAQQAVMQISGELNSRGSLNIDLFLQAMMEHLGVTGSWRVHREEMYFENTDLLPTRA